MRKVSSLGAGAIGASPVAADIDHDQDADTYLHAPIDI